MERRATLSLLVGLVAGVMLLAATGERETVWVGRGASQERGRTGVSLPAQP